MDNRQNTHNLRWTNSVEYSETKETAKQTGGEQTVCEAKRRPNRRMDNRQNAYENTQNVRQRDGRIDEWTTDRMHTRTDSM